MIEGPGSRSGSGVPLTSGFGYRRPKNMWTRRIRIRNTVKRKNKITEIFVQILVVFSFNGVLGPKADIFFIAGQPLLFKPVKGIDQLTIMEKLLSSHSMECSGLKLISSSSLDSPPSLNLLKG
jgi:hypothetical protein